MFISEDLLSSYGAEYIDFMPNQTIFSEGSKPQFYFQILTGIVEIKNYHQDGKEFTQNILSNQQCFAESFLFNSKVYPVTAVALTQCRILRLRKQDFLSLLKNNGEISSLFLQYFSARLHDNYLMLFNLSLSDPSTRIKTVIDILKRNSLFNEPFSFLIPLTRQQIANLTGLRVETVIRSIKKMEHNELLKIENGKIYF
ncbi:Crp/Fnr family transcriptional regulator [Chryseobacterium sp. PBS4-4]|uniref:Crp/Fnr family transcriptional regulator n=1 Tax=Chryseobacterium edaphi TaxID=2976532 RepID=A0ABT2W2Y1_9FLAO|nr:Crp/Fnr family transcriptional regulator [Chryseobacterium edaphi]MCU7616283.1 Crp/Fnr family transcriptional regulator [Chryseobacterium edaphi]